MLQDYLPDVVVLVVGKILPHRSGRECFNKVFGVSFQRNYFSVGNAAILLKGNNNEAVEVDLIVIGGGAAGFYAAVQAGEINPRLRILIVEKSRKLLSKVRVSGGGRCNVTHACYDGVKLSRHYPRGEKRLRAVFKEYNPKHTVAWFASKGVELK